MEIFTCTCCKILAACNLRIVFLTVLSTWLGSSPPESKRLQSRERKEKGKLPVVGRLGRDGLTNPCPWFALEVGLSERVKQLQPRVDGCLSCDKPIRHPDMCWKTRRDWKHYLKLNDEADRRLGGCEEGVLGGFPHPFPLCTPESLGEAAATHVSFQRAPCCFWRPDCEVKAPTDGSVLGFELSRGRTWVKGFRRPPSL